jgi:hypothetical protein
MRRRDRWSLVAGQLGGFTKLRVPGPVIRTWRLLVETLLDGRGPRSISGVHLARRWRWHE